MKVEEIDALLGGEAQRLSDQYREMPLDFMDGYGWAVTQICRLFHDAIPVIRCKDCEHWNCDDSESYCDELGIFNTDMNSYCSYAKRKDNGNR